MTIQIKAAEQYFPVVLALTFEAEDEILKWDHLNESFFSCFLPLSHVTMCMFFLLGS